MFRPQRLFADCDRPPGQGLRLGVTALKEIKRAQAIQAERDHGVLGSQGLGQDRLRALKKPLGVREAAQDQIKPRQVADTFGRVGMGRAQRLLAQGDGARL